MVNAAPYLLLYPFTTATQLKDLPLSPGPSAETLGALSSTVPTTRVVTHE